MTTCWCSYSSQGWLVYRHE